MTDNLKTNSLYMSYTTTFS